MIKFNKDCILLIVFGLIINSQLLSQNDFRPGFIITNSNDTLYGEVDYRGDEVMHTRCKFRSGNKIEKYFPEDIKAYRLIDGKYYIVKQINGEKLFLEYIINGKVNIYYYRDRSDDHYYINSDSLEIREITYDEEVLEIDKRLYFKESNKHKGLLFYYMQDAPELRPRIKAMKIPGHKNLTKLAVDYHNSVCDDIACVIYEKKVKKIEFNIELVSGLINFQNIRGLNDINYIQSGMLVTATIPRTNEKLVFKTGFLYARPQVYEDLKHSIKIPLHIGYIAPDRFRFRPSFSIGLLSPSYSGGISTKISKKLKVNIQSWLNFKNDRSAWIPRELFNYSVMAGISVSL